MDIKKLIIIAVAAAALAGCVKTEDSKYQIEDSKDVDRAWTGHGMSCHTKVVEIEGHKYIIIDGYYSGGIIHAASCDCMDK